MNPKLIAAIIGVVGHGIAVMIKKRKRKKAKGWSKSDSLKGGDIVNPVIVMALVGAALEIIDAWADEDWVLNN